MSADRFWLISLFLAVHISLLLLLGTVPSTTANEGTPPTACKVDIVFALDASEQTDQVEWARTLSFLNTFAASVNVGQSYDQTRIAVVSFGETAVVDIQLGSQTSAASLVVALGNIQRKSGDPDVSTALKKVHEEVFGSSGDRVGVPNVAITIMDHNPTDATKTDTEVAAMYVNNIILFAVGVGDDVDNVNCLANNPTTDFFFDTDNYVTLNKDLLAIGLADAVCELQDPTANTGELGPSCLNSIPEESESHNPGIEQRNVCYADVVFILDGSGSVGTTGWEKMMRFMKDFTRTLDVGIDLEHTSVAVVSFQATATIHIKLNDTNSVAGLHGAIDAMIYEGGTGSTNLADGILKMREAFTPQNGDRPNAPNIAILITDGSATMAQSETIPAAEDARYAGIVLVAIGIGAEISTNLLETMASIHEQTPLVFHSEDFDALVADSMLIMEKVCQYKIPCGPSDVALLLDSSGSIGEENWTKTKKFVKDFVLNLLPIGRNGNQVAVISFSSQADIHADLNSYNNYGLFSEMIDGLQHRNHKTNISGAIRLMYQDVFSATGDRPGQHGNIAIILTDGAGNVDDELTNDEAKTARAQGIHMIVVGIGQASDMQALNSIASKPKPANMILIDDFSTLISKATDVFLQVCSGRIPHLDIEDAECVGDIYIVLDIGYDLSSDMWASLRNRMIHFDNFLLDQEGPLFGTHTVHIVAMAPGQSVPPNYKMYHGNINNMAIPSAVSDTARALQMVRNQINSQNNDRRPVVVLITDGRSTLKSEDARNEAKQLQLRGASIFAVGFGGFVHLDHLAGVASSPTEFFARKTDSIDTMTELSHVLDLRTDICYASAKQYWSCSFEINNVLGDFCGTTVEPQEENSFRWILGEHGTASEETGPSRAYRGNKYAYVEASHRVWDSADPLKTTLYLPTTYDLSGFLCLYFHYHMYGLHQGALQVHVEQGHQRSLVWTKSGNQGDEWMFAKVQLDLKLTNNDVPKIMFRAILGSNYQSDTAIDDVRLVKGPCYP